jgi:hypothetical protein
LTDISRGEIGVSDIDGTRGKVGEKSCSGKGITVALLEAALITSILPSRTARDAPASRRSIRLSMKAAGK